MTTKDKLLHAVEDLPADATIEDAMECFLFLAKVERGLKQADAGRTISHEEIAWSDPETKAPDRGKGAK